MQRGANSFTTSTAMAALELTSRLVHAIQSTAETAYDMVSPGPSVRYKNKGQKGRRKRHSQPLDIREGVANAYMLVKEVFAAVIFVEVEQLGTIHFEEVFKIYVQSNDTVASMT